MAPIDRRAVVGMLGAFAAASGGLGGGALAAGAAADYLQRDAKSPAASTPSSPKFRGAEAGGCPWC